MDSSSDSSTQALPTLSLSSPHAVVSVSDKRNLSLLGDLLTGLGRSILGSSGTVRALQKNGVKATLIPDYTKSPECLGGRVKTLHPAVFAGILARRDQESHLFDLESLQYALIDVVVCSLYPFVDAFKQSKHLSLIHI